MLISCIGGPVALMTVDLLLVAVKQHLQEWYLNLGEENLNLQIPRRGPHGGGAGILYTTEAHKIH